MGVKVWVEAVNNKKAVYSRIRKKFPVSGSSPGFVFIYGGDGTLLLAERKYPGVPKIFIRKERKHVCGFCPYYYLENLDVILNSLKHNKYKIREFPKVEALFRGKTLTGMNEIQVHTKKPTHAIRFFLAVGMKKFSQIIGDGIIASTPFGSTAYFSSIGGKPFKKGLRIGFNNTIPKIKPIPILKTARVKIIREDAWLIADNNPDMPTLKPGDSVEIRESKKKARFVEVKV